MVVVSNADMDSDIKAFFEKKNRLPSKHTDFDSPITTSSVYGWDTEPLIRFTDRRFHHPKIVTEITKKYTSIVAKPKESEVKK